MTFAKAQIESLHSIGMFVQQIAQITGAGTVGGDSEQHADGRGMVNAYFITVAIGPERFATIPQSLNVRDTKRPCAV